MGRERCRESVLEKGEERKEVRQTEREKESALNMKGVSLFPPEEKFCFVQNFR